MDPRAARAALDEITRVMARAHRHTAVSGPALIASGLLAAAAGVGLCWAFPEIRARVPVTSFWRLRNTFTLVWGGVFVGAAALNLWALHRRGRAQADANWGRRLRVLGQAFVPAVIVCGLLGVYAVRQRWGWYALSAPLWLFCYGLGLWAAAPYTVAATRWAGLAFLAVGGAALFVLDPSVQAPQDAHFYDRDRWSQLFMAAGFGGIHLLLGVAVIRQDRRAAASDDG